jgi:tetratricopeptide (TPR) repeat protein
VESVAWAAELKDVLAGLFSTLAIGAYLFWLRRPSVARHFSASAAVALALMSKPTAVALPLLFLVLDWWPLGRIRAIAPRRLIVEKLPWLAMALATAAVTLTAQSQAGAMGSVQTFPIAQRLAAAAAAFASYLSKAIWPAGLSFFYPYPPGGFSPGRSAAGALLLLMLAGAATALRRRFPWLAAGLAWFVVGLLPTAGLVQVGVQSMADRYTYLPLTGVFLAVAFSLPRRGRPGVIAMLLILACLCLAAMTARHRARDWRDTATLARRALDADPDNWMAHAILGREDLQARRPDAGLRHLAEALRLEQRDSRVWFDYGLALLQSGDRAAAARAFDQAARLNPNQSGARAFRDLAARPAASPDPPRR